jgi:hypothetical protein
MSSATVFFSWQSDRPTKEGRNLIERALTAALERISKDIQVDERPHDLVLDKDTKDTPGSPPIFDTIISKIDRAAVFVPDLTFVAQRQNGEPFPNANVLIEYGYALKSIGHNRIVALMNTAYGKPKRETMPFDLSHHRYPIQYDVPENAPDEERRAQRDQLSKTLESAIREVLASEAYKSSLAHARPPEYRQPLDGRARFRAKGEPIGFYDNLISNLMGHADSPISLSDGPAMWLRIIPQTPIPTPLKIVDIRKMSGELFQVPLYNGYTSTFFVRGKDGAGLFPIPEEGTTPTLLYVFTDGEIWFIDTFPFKSLPKLIPLDENGLAKSLQQCAAFLSDHLGIKGPFHWIVGLEGIAGRLLPIPNDRMSRTRGPCASDLIEQKGDYTIGQDPFDAMESFFAKVCEQCGIPRHPRNARPPSS